MKHLLLVSLLLCVFEGISQVKKKTPAPPNTVVCGNYGVVDNFSQAVNPKNWHDYDVGPTKVCNTLESAACTMDNVYAILLNNAQLIAPGAQPIPVVNCKVYNIDVFTVQGPVLIRTNYGNRTIENFTMEGHDLHPGKVTHTIEQIGNDIYLYTRGVGNGDYKFLYTNKGSALATWKPRHLRFRDAVVDRLKVSVVPDAIQSRWIHAPINNDQTSIDQKEKKADCGFDWTDWGSVASADKSAMKKIMVSNPGGDSDLGSLFQYITDQIKGGNKIQIARHDFFEKGEPGYVLSIAYPSPRAGTKGRVEVYEDLGKLFLTPPVDITDNLCAVKPDPDNSGIIGENNQEHTLSGLSAAFDELYKNFLRKTNPSQTAQSPTKSHIAGRLGASSPEDLAKLLLKCIKTNDIATWMRCLHPDDTVETDDVSASKFARHREVLEANGITDWSSIQFSRFIYALRPMGGSKIDPSQVTPIARTEFTYKNGEFVGVVHMGTFKLYEGKWLIWYSGQPEDDKLDRQTRR